MNRRRFLARMSGIAAAGLPFVSQAQNQKVWRVGFLALGARSAIIDADHYGGFARGMRELGYIEGRNLAIDWKFAEGSNDQMAAMAVALVQSGVDVIVTVGVPPTAAARKATATMPIVMATSTDPVGAGLVASLSRPGGNVTGLTNIATDVSPKHLDFLRSVVPKLARVGVLTNADTSTHVAMAKSVGGSAQSTNIAVLQADARTRGQIDTAIGDLARSGAGALIVLLAPLFHDARSQIAQVAMKHRLPSISSVWQYAEAGGLIAYGPNLLDQFRRAATYVDKIFKGAKPAELPIEQPTSYELVINRKTAQALRVTLPQDLVLQADKVI